MLVQRRGGTVALKAVTEAIKQVQVGTDKTAAELALVRLQNELSLLRSQHRKALALVKSMGPGHGDGFLDKLANALLGKPGQEPVLRMRQIEARIAEVERQIARNRLITER
jgi:hypothetical protein